MRPRNVWLIYALCSLVVLATLAWVIMRAYDADRLRWQAEMLSQRDQNVRLALWRMDTKLAPLIAEETARPSYAYQPSVYQASPLQSTLVNPAYNVFLNFEADPAGNWRSPQVPIEQSPEQANRRQANQKQALQAPGPSLEQLQDNRKRLDQLAAKIDLPELIGELPEQGNYVAVMPTPNLPPPSVPSTNQSRDGFGREYGGNYSNGGGYSDNPFADESGDKNEEEDIPQQIALPKVASKGKGGDYAQREQRYQQQARQEFSKQRGYGSAINAPAAIPATDGSASVVESMSRPLWMNDQLLLARRIRRNGQMLVQGSWLDWANLKKELLDEVEDLFPQADLVPLSDPEAGDPTRMLAGLPVQLQLPLFKNVYQPNDAMISMLLLSSAAVLLALGAVAGLLWGVLALSERRAAFVSSVTHELRTPLTTFRMYSEMLAGGMVPQAERRQKYLETLRVESERLSHLVENVLSYARLERGRGPSLDDRTTPGELIERFEKRLADRAKLADMELVVEVDPAVADVPIQTDLGVVEQILFNLVDNAAKYARSAEDKRIHLQGKIAATKPGRRSVAFAVRDHGPGYESERSASRAPAFSKSAQKAAETAPGVGLGLALCRRLAKQLGGGYLEAANHPEGGAVATLTLPLAA
ncbi:sensor histidine kinase [Adhaeretor mobilis]|uniref:histidine kinase n=1 Tax=Adhaeretor mobilis TaxID=1930276 RepID=A0A517N0I7_9BACT|nr:HAMP domain-containing sensor histidine kinase [Adhaeretor mobilis]QDT00646.1 Sensor protein KdpD [Adhaeretor mobilis]